MGRKSNELSTKASSFKIKNSFTANWVQSITNFETIWLSKVWNLIGWRIIWNFDRLDRKNCSNSWFSVRSTLSTLRKWSVNKSHEWISQRIIGKGLNSESKSTSWGYWIEKWDPQRWTTYKWTKIRELFSTRSRKKMALLPWKPIHYRQLQSSLLTTFVEVYTGRWKEKSH